MISPIPCENWGNENDCRLEVFTIFAELYSLQESLPPEELAKSRDRRLEYLIRWRKTMDSLKPKLG